MSQCVWVCVSECERGKIEMMQVANDGDGSRTLTPPLPSHPSTQHSQLYWGGGGCPGCCRDRLTRGPLAAVPDVHATHAAVLRPGITVAAGGGVPADAGGGCRVQGKRLKLLPLLLPLLSLSVAHYRAVLLLRSRLLCLATRSGRLTAASKLPPLFQSAHKFHCTTPHRPTPPHATGGPCAR